MPTADARRAREEIASGGVQIGRFPDRKLEAALEDLMVEALTRGVRVAVESEYVADRSDPEEESYFFAYHVTIRNEGEEPVQLVSRHWIIADAGGREQEVRGLGVVGRQPRLEPGESFRYTSACPLTTPVGSMRGTYQMVQDDGETFEAIIPTFTLAVPGMLQ